MADPGRDTQQAFDLLEKLHIVRMAIADDRRDPRVSVLLMQVERQLPHGMTVLRKLEHLRQQHANDLAGLLTRPSTVLQADVDACTKDALQEATRGVKRNLNLIWGTALFAWIAQGFAWKGSAKILDIEVQPTWHVALAMLLLIAVHAWQFYNYSRTDKSGPDMARLRLEWTCRTTEKKTEGIWSLMEQKGFFDDLTPDHLSVSRNLPEWLAENWRLVEATEKVISPAKQREYIDFMLPLHGAALVAGLLVVQMTGRWW